LLGVDPSKAAHVKNWKPQLLVLGYLDEEGAPKQPGLIALINQLKKGNGLNIFGTCIVDAETKENYTKAKLASHKLHGYFRQKRMEVFSKVVLSKDLRKGFKNLIQNTGLGGLEPNTILMAWPEDWKEQPVRASRFCKLVGYAKNCNRALFVPKPVENFNITEKLLGCIDIWWFCYEGGLMCLLAYLLQKHRCWQGCTVRVFYVLTGEDEGLKLEMTQKIEDWINRYRIFKRVFTEVVVVPPETMMQHSKHFYAEDRLNVNRLGDNKESVQVLDQFQRTQLELVKQVIGQSGRPDASDDGVKLNQKILEYSASSDLVVTVLPEKGQEQTPEELMQFCENMTNGLKRVILVRGTDDSVVTDYT
jgi:potassium/chloride transporter 4/5/6